MGGLCGRAVPSVAIVCYYRGFSRRLHIFVLDLSSKISIDFSDAAHNYAGGLIHPI